MKQFKNQMGMRQRDLKTPLMTPYFGDLLSLLGLAKSLKLNSDLKGFKRLLEECIFMISLCESLQFCDHSFFSFFVRFVLMTDKKCHSQRNQKGKWGFLTV